MISDGGVKSSARLFNFPLWSAFGATVGNKNTILQTLGKLRMHGTANQGWVCPYSWPPTSTSRRVWHTLVTVVSLIGHSLYCRNSCTQTETQTMYRNPRYACVNKWRDVARQRKTNQLHQGQFLFPKEKGRGKKEELPWVGFEPTTLCSLGERSTNTRQRQTSNHCAMAQYTLTQHIGADRGN